MRRSAKAVFFMHTSTGGALSDNYCTSWSSCTIFLFWLLSLPISLKVGSKCENEVERNNSLTIVFCYLLVPHHQYHPWFGTTLPCWKGTNFKISHDGHVFLKFPIFQGRRPEPPDFQHSFKGYQTIRRSKRTLPLFFHGG